MISLLCLHLSTKYLMKNNPCVILPNWYGILDYVHDLETSLSQNWLSVESVVFPWQNGKEWLLTIESASNEVLKVIESQNSDKVDLIVHCSSLMILESLGNTLDWFLDKVIVYNYLANPEIHKNRFLKKSKSYGVRIWDFSDDLIKYSDPSIYKNIPWRLHIIHPQTSFNALRASKFELEELLKNKNIASLATPASWYEITDGNQKEIVEKVVSDNIYPILSST